jgi:hypothetical protein
MAASANGPPNQFNEVFVKLRILRVSVLTACIVIPLWTSFPAQAANVLITDEEAKLPPPRGAFATDRRGITRGPKVDFSSPAAPMHSPMHLQLKFESYGGAKVDVDSVKVTYLRTPNVDLTSRLKSFVTPDGIDVPDVQLPVGEHMVRVDIKDSDGRMGSTSFVLKVVQ